MRRGLFPREHALTFRGWKYELRSAKYERESCSLAPFQGRGPTRPKGVRGEGDAHSNYTHNSPHRPRTSSFVIRTSALLFLTLCATLSATELNSDALQKLDAAILSAIENHNLPGAVLHLESNGVIYTKPFGLRAKLPQEEAATLDTIYDAASLTKVLATSPSILLLAERGKLDLDKPAAAYIPEFAAEGKDAITLKHLLTHTSGLRPGLDHSTKWSGADEALKRACAEKPLRAPGKAFEYSDINYIVLGEIVHRVSGERIDTFAAREIYAPLKMIDTGYLPAAEKIARIAPTEKADEGTFLRGVVHDPTARRMDGVAGHAGIFTTASDLARYCRMLLNAGELDGVRIFKPETVALLTTNQLPTGIFPAHETIVPDANNIRRAFGFDIVSPYDGPRGTRFSANSFGHTGWTGTSLWIDPPSKTFVILLSNRNHPDGHGDVRALRRTVGTLAADAAGVPK